MVGDNAGTLFRGDTDLYKSLIGVLALGLALICSAQAANDSQYTLTNAFVNSNQETLKHLLQDCSALPAAQKEACTDDVTKLQAWVNHVYDSADRAFATRHGPGRGVYNENSGLDDSAGAATAFAKWLAVFYRGLGGWRAASTQAVSQK